MRGQHRGVRRNVPSAGAVSRSFARTDRATQEWRRHPRHRREIRRQPGPRLEGLFARIERWTRLDDHADVHWRSLSKDNILSVYGGDATSRLHDPGDPARIFTWLICETRDDKGNGILYRYKPEDGAGVDP